MGVEMCFIILAGFEILVDMIFLWFYCKGYKRKENKGGFVFITYFCYFGVNFFFMIRNVNSWIRLFCNMAIIFLFLFFVYRDINVWNAIREAVTFISIREMAVLFVSVIDYYLINNFSANIYYKPIGSDVCIMFRSLSGLIALCLFVLYRKTKQSNHFMKKRCDIFILYFPLMIAVSFLLIIIKMFSDFGCFEESMVWFLIALITDVLVVYVLIHMILFEHFILYRENNRKLHILLEKEELKYEYYHNLLDSFEDIRMMHHDLKHHIFLVAQNSLYCENIEKSLKRYEELYDCGNDIVNILLWEKRKEALKYGIQFECIVERLNLNFIDNLDLCSIMGNVLDNAIEAGREVSKQRNALISIKIACMNDLILFKVVNDCIGKSRIQRKDHTFISTKGKGGLHGIGLRSVLHAVKKYDGNCEFYVKNDQFISEIIIPGAISQSDISK